MTISKIQHAKLNSTSSKIELDLPVHRFAEAEDRFENTSSPSPSLVQAVASGSKNLLPEPQDIAHLNCELRALFKQGRYAETYCLINSLPKRLLDASILTVLAYCEYNMGRTSASYESLNKAIALHPQDSEAYKLRGDLHTKLNKYDEALNDYTIARQIAPCNVEISVKKAQTLIALDRLDEALELLYMESKLNKKDYHIWFCYGNAFFIQENFSSAIAAFTQAIKCCPSDPRSYEQRSLAYEAAGDQDAARRDIFEAQSVWKKCTRNRLRPHD